MKSKRTPTRRARAKLPHHGAYTRLRPSETHKGGVGVFPIRKIPKGAHIFTGDEDTEYVDLDRRKVERLAPKLRKLYRDFSIITNHGRVYRSPKNFNLMTISWYLNEPRPGEKSNVRCGKNDLFYALRDIKPDEELTVDYKTYNEFK